MPVHKKTSPAPSVRPISPERKKMPGIFYHKHARQYAVCITIKGQRKTFYLGTDVKAAEIQYHKLMVEHKEDRLPIAIMSGGNMEFCYLANAFLESIKAEYPQGTYKDYQSALSTIANFRPSLNVCQIDLPFLKELKHFLLYKKAQVVRKKVGLSKDRVNRYMKYIRMVLKWGVNNNYLRPQDAAIPYIKPERTKKPPPRFFSNDEIRNILDCEKVLLLKSNCKQTLKEITIPQTFAMIRFMLSTGRRIQEVVHLKKKDIKFELGYYEVTKDKTERTNPVPKIFYLNDQAVDALLPYYRLRNNGDDYIFCNQDGGFLTPTAAGTRIKRIFRMAGITDAASKEFRHSFASHLLMSGERLEEVRDHLGHTDVRTTQIYAHLSNVHLKKSIRNLKIQALEAVGGAVNSPQPVQPVQPGQTVPPT